MQDNEQVKKRFQALLDSVDEMEATIMPLIDNGNHVEGVKLFKGSLTTQRKALKDGLEIALNPPVYKEVEASENDDIVPMVYKVTHNPDGSVTLDSGTPLVEGE